jgi:hypothetical protein
MLSLWSAKNKAKKYEHDAYLRHFMKHDEWILEDCGDVRLPEQYDSHNCGVRDNEFLLFLF